MGSPPDVSPCARGKYLVFVAKGHMGVSECLSCLASQKVMGYYDGRGKVLFQSSGGGDGEQVPQTKLGFSSLGVKDGPLVRGFAEDVNGRGKGLFQSSVGGDGEHASPTEKGLFSLRVKLGTLVKGSTDERQCGHKLSAEREKWRRDENAFKVVESLTLRTLIGRFEYTNPRHQDILS